MCRKKSSRIPHSVSRRAFGGTMKLNYEQCSVCRAIRITNGSQHSGWMLQERLQVYIDGGHEMERVKLVHCSKCTTVAIKVLL